SEQVTLPVATAATGATGAFEGVISEGELTSAEGDSDFLFGGAIDSANPIGLNEDAYRAAKANGYLHFHGKGGYGDEGIISEKENLFKVISNRYFLSYPRMMHKKIVGNERTE